MSKNQARGIDLPESGEITIAETTFTLKYTKNLPQLVGQEFDDLLHDIARRRILTPIIIDENHNVIDGAHRLLAAYILGLKTIPILVVPGLSEDEKYEMALALNLHRRHLTPRELAQLAKKNKKLLPGFALRLRQKGQSYRQIGEALGVSHMHVRSLIQTATVNENTVDLPNVVVGRDGKKRAAKVKPKPMPAVYVNSVTEIQRATLACNTAGAERLPNKIMPLKSAEKAAHKKVIDDLREQEYEDLEIGRAKLMLGDFRLRSRKIKNASVDLVFTDPEYQKAKLPLWEDLARICAQKLKPGGLLVSYSGVQYLPQIHQMLGNHLTYLWTAAIRHTGRIKLFRPVQMLQAWKPILIYFKPPLSKYWRPFTDMVSGGEAKSNHQYEQAVDEALHYIRALCPENGVLWDPMMGSATTIVAGLEASRGLTCIGCDIDKAAFATAQERVRETIERLQTKRDSA